MTGVQTCALPIFIRRVKVVSFKITGLTITAIKLRSFLKRIIGAYMAGR